MPATSHVTLEPVDPRKLSLHDYRALHEVTQDMWAYGIGEFVSCDHCVKTFSKKDIFGSLPGDISTHTVAHIMRDQGMKSVACPHCRRNTRILYGEEFIGTLREKLSASVYSIIVIAKTEGSRIVGYMDAYVDAFDRIHAQDLSAHYGASSRHMIRERVERTLDQRVDTMISFSEAGFVQAYGGLQHFFSLYRHIFRGFDSAYISTPGITELDKNNKTLYKIYTAMGSKPVEIPRDKMQGVHTDYASVVSVFDAPVQSFRERYDYPLKEFITKFLK